MPRFDRAASVKRRSQVTVFGDHYAAAQQRAKHCFDRNRHTDCSFADGKQENAIERGKGQAHTTGVQRPGTQMEMAVNGVAGLSGIQSTLKDSQGVPAKTGL
jgi:hypothetical protein